MDLDWFKDLAALARTGNFSRAAEQCYISQSAFSRRIRSLEAWVGVQLVDRSSHPVTLTEPGRQILEAGSQAVERIETERSQILEALQQPDRYVVTFGAQHSIAWRFFPAWLQAFERSFGAIISRLRADNLPDCTADLVRGEMDFVIAYHSKGDVLLEGAPDSVSLRIGTDQLIPVCRPGPFGRPLFPIDGEHGHTIPYLRFGPSAAIGKHIEPVIAAAGLGALLNPIYENSMAGALRIRARDGAGVAWLPRSLVEADMDSGLLTIAGKPAWWMDLEVRVHRRRDERNPLLVSIWDFLAAREGDALV